MIPTPYLIGLIGYTGATATLASNLLLNNLLPWDSSYLDTDVRFTNAVIEQKWRCQGIEYSTIRVPAGLIYCIARAPRDNFPLMVEEMKTIFGVPKCGTHRIRIKGRHYLLYQVNISNDGRVIQETALHKLDRYHPLRSDPQFRRNVQRLLIFCEILSLTSTGEPNIRIRIASDGSYIPVATNEFDTTLNKEQGHDFNILKKGLFLSWFGEQTNMSDVAREMVNCRSVNDITSICHDIRNRVSAIIGNYNSNYTWFASFICDRLSRYLL